MPAIATVAVGPIHDKNNTFSFHFTRSRLDVLLKTEAESAVLPNQLYGMTETVWHMNKVVPPPTGTIPKLRGISSKKLLVTSASVTSALLVTRSYELSFRMVNAAEVPCADADRRRGGERPPISQLDLEDNDLIPL